MINPVLSSEIDHLVALVDDSEYIFEKIKKEFEKSGFPVSLNSGKEGKNFKTITPFVGRSYFEMLRLLGGASDECPDCVNQWNKGGVRGVVMLFLRVKDLDVIYKTLCQNKVYVKEPYREYYGVKRNKKSMPLRYLDLPIIEDLPLWIRWIQYDTMMWNMLRTGPKPNSKNVNGVDHFDSIKIKGPFTSEDFSLLEKVFPKIGDGEINQVNLRNSKLLFEKSKKTGIEIVALTDDDDYIGKQMKMYNFDIKVRGM
ncbi:MAG: hypothetical protein K8T10_06515 [Candidatus Eremiobacteraeota bacterium]|nr:hypothetical protein [Candidatus Eremiobacteraeota bacterium]